MGIKEDLAKATEAIEAVGDPSGLPYYDRVECSVDMEMQLMGILDKVNKAAYLGIRVTASRDLLPRTMVFLDGNETVAVWYSGFMWVLP